MRTFRLWKLAGFAVGVLLLPVLNSADGDPAPAVVPAPDPAPAVPPTPTPAPAPAPTPAADTAAADPVALVTASQKAFLYAGADLKARITMVLFAKDGRTRNRVMTMLRRNADTGNDQKYFIYFHEPGDVRGMTFMVWKYVQKEDDRWLFIPAVDLVKRIAANDSRSSFVGSDFTYEDISGREIDADAHSLLRSEKIGDRDCYVVQSVPKAAVEYAKRLVWIDKGNKLPLKEEYYDGQGALLRAFSADKVEDLTVGEGDQKMTVPTITKRTMKNLKTGHRTEVAFNQVTYNNSLKDEDFSERRLRQPPKEWITK